MTKRMSRVSRILIWTAILLALSSCGEDDTKWEIGREGLGGIEANRHQVDEEWNLFRDELVRSLDQMSAALRITAGDAAVVDQKEINDLVMRIKNLRGDVVALVDEPRETLSDARARIRERFDVTRTTVDALLLRLGGNPDDIASWQDAR